MCKRLWLKNSIICWQKKKLAFRHVFCEMARAQSKKKFKIGKKKKSFDSEAVMLNISKLHENQN